MARRKRRDPLRETGIRLLGMGVGLLVFGWFAGGVSPLLKGLAPALRTSSLLLMGVGGLLLLAQALPRWLAARRTTEIPAAAPRPERREPTLKVAYDANAAREVLRAEGSAAPVAAQATAAPAESALPQAPNRWGPEVFAVIEWRRFEAVVEQLFAQAGFTTRAQSHGPDGGVDVWLHSRHAQGPVSVVQCKHWQGRQVPVSAMREFFGVMASHGLKRGTYATTSRFTSDALAFAKANGINAQDGESLLKLIASRTPEQQAALLATALEGEYWRPTCPSCGVKMVEPRGQKFWGCPNYGPRACRTKIYKTRTSAARTLPT